MKILWYNLLPNKFYLNTMDSLVSSFYNIKKRIWVSLKLYESWKCIKAKNVFSILWVVCQFDDTSFSRRKLKSFLLEIRNHLWYLKNEHKKFMYHRRQNFDMLRYSIWNFSNLQNMIKNASQLLMETYFQKVRTLLQVA